MRNIFEGIGILVLLGVVVFGAFITMVAEPECERKGFAGVDRDGCWIMKDGERVYE